jgi:uncharacterized protein YggE
MNAPPPPRGELPQLLSGRARRGDPADRLDGHERRARHQAHPGHDRRHRLSQVPDHRRPGVLERDGELRAKAAAVAAYLGDAGLAGDVSKPPVDIQATSVQVPTGLKKPRFRSVPAFQVTQSFDVQTTKIDTLVRAAASVDRLLLQGVDVSVSSLEYLSTKLKTAKFAALRLATADAEERASTIAQGLGGNLGAVRNVSLGVYQITPRNSTDVSNEGINDTSSRAKDVTAVVSVTFAVKR